MPRILWFFLTLTSAFAQSNPELGRLYGEDQKDRANWFTMTAAERDAMVKNDAVRRRRLSEMLRAGVVKSGEDYERAAFIFQHGSEPADYLLAHVLAMTAMAVDAGPGRWIATATLDRYLLSIGKPQIFGNDLDPKTPSDWNLVPEPVRAANCVPSKAEHERMVEAIAKKTTPPLTGPCQPKMDEFMGRWLVVEKMPGGKLLQAVIELRDEGAVATIETNGHTSELEDLTMGDRELRFRIGAQQYRLKVHAGMMSGSFAAPGGPAGQLAGLR